MKRLLRRPGGRALPAVLLSLLLFGCASDEFEPIGDLDPDVPFPVDDLAITVVGDTLRATWTASGDDGPNGTATRYDLRRHDVPLDEANWADATPLAGLPRPGPAGTIEQFDLPPVVTTFFLGLKVIDDQGNASGLSNVVYLDRSPPTRVSDLAVRFSDHGTAILQWTAPADDGRTGAAAGYELRASTGDLASEPWSEALPVRYAPPTVGPGGPEVSGLSDLLPATAYQVGVRSRDPSGNLSELSNIVAFTTAAEPRGWWDGFTSLGFAGDCYALYATADTLYAGGRFAAAGGTALSAVGAWDGNAWHAMGPGMSGGSFGTAVFDFQEFGGRLFTVGSFGMAGGAVVGNVAAWTGSGWEYPGWSSGQFPPFCLAVWQDELYVGGPFDMAGGLTFTSLVRYDGTTWTGMGWSNSDGGYPEVLLPRDGDLVVGGVFDILPGTSANSLAMWNGSRYAIPGVPLAGRLEQPVITAAIEYQGDLVVGGDFVSAGGVALNGIARWDGERWHSLGGGLTAENFPSARALAVFRGYLVAGGVFDTAGGKPAKNIALWNGLDWQPMGEGLTGPGYTDVTDLAVFQGSLYVSGRFTAADGIPSDGIARWDHD